MYRENSLSPRMMDSRTVSRLYGIPLGTLLNWRSQKRGPKYYKVSRKAYYAVEDVERFFKQKPVLTTESLPEPTGKGKKANDS